MSVLDDIQVQLTEEDLTRARRSINPDLLKDRTLGEKLTVMRELTNQTNGNIADMLGEKKRTFESWISGRYTPEGRSEERLNAILVYTTRLYLESIFNETSVRNVFGDFPIAFQMLDFNDAMNVISYYLQDKGYSIDYSSGDVNKVKNKSSFHFSSYKVLYSIS